MENMHVVYHWWNCLHVKEVYLNHNPIILSIANLREKCDAPITVLDITESETDWAHYPEKLNFKVEKVSPYCKKFSDKVAGWQHLSRIFDIEIWAKNNNINKVMYVDSDFFFFNNPFPLSGDTDKFCWDGWNSGFFYLDFSSKSNQEFLEVFKAHTVSAIYDEEVRDTYNPYKTYEAWYGVWDEMILLSMKTKNPDFFYVFDFGEHLTLKRLPPQPKSFHKGFHCNGLNCVNPTTNENHCRKIIPLLSQEFYDSISSILSPSDLDQFFSKELQEYFRNKISIYKIAASSNEQNNFNDIVKLYDTDKIRYYGL